jgi:HK97 family phage portal protein
MRPAGRRIRAAITTSRELEQALIAQDVGTAAQVILTPKTALMVQAVGCAVAILAESVAQLPIVVFRDAGDRRRERITDDDVFRVLHDRPNGWQDSFQFRELLQTHLALWGNCYAFKNRLRSTGRLQELLPIHPDRVRVEQDEQYRVTYRVSLPNGNQVVLGQDKVFHIRDRSLNGYEGLSRLKSGRDSIGLAMAAERWGGQLFGNSARPAGVLSTDKSLTGDQIKQIASSWQAAHGGENALGTAVLDGGFKWEPLVMNNKDAQFLETRKFQIAEVARLYRIPPHMLADLDRATFSNIEQQSLEFVKYSLMPWLRRWEAAVNAQLLMPEMAGRVRQRSMKFNVDGLLRADIKTRYEAYAIGRQNGWLSTNDVREQEDLNPIEGGDDYTPASNLFGDERDEPSQPS